MTTRAERTGRRRWRGLQKARHDYDDDGTTVDVLGPEGKRGRCTNCGMPWRHEVHKPAPKEKPKRQRRSDVDAAMAEHRRRIGERDDEVRAS